MNSDKVEPLLASEQLPLGAQNTGVQLSASARAALAARWSFAAVIVLIPFSLHATLQTRPVQNINSGYTDLLLYATDVLVLIMLASWLLSLALAPRKILLGPRHMWIPLAGLTLAGALSVPSSFDIVLSVYHAIRVLVLFCFYIFIVNEVHTPAWVLVPASAQVVIQSVVALAQSISQKSIGLQALGEAPLDPAASGVSVVVAHGVRLLRAYGLTDHPNILGGCLAFGLVLVLPACIQRRVRIPLAAIFIAGIGALLVSFSRSAWLAFLAGAVIIGAVEILNRRGEAFRPILAVGLASMFVLATFLFAYRGFFGVRLNTDRSFSSPSAEQQSIGERVILISNTMPLLQDHMLLGVGVGASPLALKAYYPIFELRYEPPHLALFDAALETGILGGLCCMALMVFPVFVFIRRWRELLPNRLAAVALALLIAIGVAGFFDYYTWLLPAGRLWQWMAWGTWAAVLKVDAA